MKYALLGFGTVGVGVYEMVNKLHAFECGKVLVRPGKVKEPWQTDDFREICEDPSVDIVVEVMGGLHPAYEYVRDALTAGKHVVTANKQLVAAYGVELQKIALEQQVAFLFSPACGGGIPFLHNLALAAYTDHVTEVGGILNGTTNYMLDAMQRRGWSYEEALRNAQALGYAEAIPDADVGGMDAAAKIRLACGVAFDLLPEVEGMCVEGITSFTAADVAHLQSKGLVCKLIAKGGRLGNSIYAYVEPAIFEQSTAEAMLPDNYNLVKYLADNAGDMTYSGQGAGRYPTASAVVRDMQDIFWGRRLMFSAALQNGKVDPNACSHPYYVRVAAAFADRVPAERREQDGEDVRIITPAMSVGEMHALAAELRNAGAAVFFAGMEA